MKKNQNKNSKSGFSLVELMVVVAIIGILATIAIPNFQKFQARSKQSAAKSELTGIFTAQKGFYAEYSIYHAELPLIGFVPEGHTMDANNCPTAIAPNVIRNYNVGFSAAGGGLPAGISAMPCGASIAASLHVRYEAGVGAGGNAASVRTTASAPAAALLVAPDGTQFRAGAEGVISATGTKTDQWQMDQNRAMTNVQQGI